MKNAKKRSKYWNPIYRDPVGWARKFGGSKTRVVTIIIFQHLSTCMIYLGFWIAPPATSGFGPAVMLFVLAAGFPSLYIYAVYRLVKVIDEHATNP